MESKDSYKKWYAGSMYKQKHPAASMPMLARFFKETETRTVLDFYCGAGRNAIFLSKEGFKVSGFDRSEFAIRTAKEKQRDERTNVKFKHLELKTRLPYKSQSFDAVIGIRALYQARMATIRKLSREIDRVLKSGGYVYLESHLKERVWRMPELRGKIKKVERGTYQYLSNKRYYHYFNKEELKSLFDGYKTIKFNYMPYRFKVLVQKP